MPEETEIKLARFSRVPPGAAMDTMLSKRALRVLVALCGHANKKDICRPSQARLAKVSNLSRQKVNVALKELCERQWITLVGKRRGRGQWPSNVYKINFNKPVEGAIVPPPRHPKGDTNHVTPPVTSRRHPTGDTNKPIEHKRKEQRRTVQRLSPYAALTNTLTQMALSPEHVDSIMLNLDQRRYEDFCREYDTLCDTTELVHGFVLEFYAMSSECQTDNPSGR